MKSVRDRVDAFRFFYLKIHLKIVFPKRRHRSFWSFLLGPAFVLLIGAPNPHRTQFGWSRRGKSMQRPLLQLSCHLGHLEMSSADRRCEFSVKIHDASCFSTLVSLLPVMDLGSSVEQRVPPCCKSLLSCLLCQSEMEFKRWLKIRYR